jgi:hypothetical protein
MDVVARRLRAQRLVGRGFASAADCVRWFGAVQAQDYRGGLWAVGQRVARAREADIEAAIEAREIVRTWPLRGTIHLVAAEDVRWMVRWFAPRVISRGAARYRELGLDGATFARARDVLERELDGVTRTRPELYAALERGGVSPTGQRGIHMLGYWAIQGVLCMGAHRGKQATFARMDDWVPGGRELGEEEAHAELAARYLASHGPATDADFAWWSGLGLGEARRAIAAAGPVELARAGKVPPSAHLLPPFDEYTVAYKDRSAVVDAKVAKATQNGLSPIVLVDGRVAGTWARRAGAIEAQLFRAAPGLEQAAQAYGRFVGAPVTLKVRSRRRG